MRLIAILSPTDKWGTKTEYARLKKFLLKDGYIRIGPEVFMRVVQIERLPRSITGELMKSNLKQVL